MLLATKGGDGDGAGAGGAVVVSCLSLTVDWTAPSHLRNTDVTGREGKPQLTPPLIGEWEEVGKIRHSRLCTIRK